MGKHRSFGQRKPSNAAFLGPLILIQKIDILANMAKWMPKRLADKLLIGSTLVEGSTLSEKEAVLALKGKTIEGHPSAEIRELLNYEAATLWLVKTVGESPYLSLDVVRAYHLRLFSGLGSDAGQFKSSQNYTYRSDGTRVDFEKPSLIKPKLQEWIDRFNHSPSPKDVALRGAKLYYDFEMLHPFSDGNGRMGRVFMAYWFWRQDGSSFEFYAKDKSTHLKALQEANSGNMDALKAFIQSRLK